MGRRWWAGPGLGPSNFTTWTAARSGPSNFHLVGRTSNFQRMGRGPAHHIFKNSRPGPARPINFSNIWARAGPAHDILNFRQLVFRGQGGGDVHLQDRARGKQGARVRWTFLQPGDGPDYCGQS